MALWSRLTASFFRLTVSPLHRASRSPHPASFRSFSAGSGADFLRHLSRLLPVTPELGKFLGGVSEFKREYAIGQTYAYISQNNLEDPIVNDIVNCDGKLKAIFDGEEIVFIDDIRMLIDRHFSKALGWKLENDVWVYSAIESHFAATLERARACELLVARIKAAKQARAAAKPPRPLPVTPELGKFLGGVSEIPRDEAINRMWDYIYQNNLQHPTCKEVIICDEKLKTFFNGKGKVLSTEISNTIDRRLAVASGWEPGNQKWVNPGVCS